ncbi:uncharacterized protein LOC141590305 [Silene latifolia]|uniref:uncharacterized protein LOC141590305 n=1 Tax=Silene latifolia TaxID=37657 RepID=UPI003D77CA14
MKGCEWSSYSPPVDCSWTWKKITHIMKKFQQAYTNNQWLNSPTEYTVKAGYSWLCGNQPKVRWRFLCWNTLNIPKSSFICWGIMHQRLLTKDRLLRMGIIVDGGCEICAAANEDHKHIFSDCQYTRQCLSLFQLKMQVPMDLTDMITWFSKCRGITKFQKRFVGACYVDLLYSIWLVRNDARINGLVKSPRFVIQKVIEDVLHRFQRLNTSNLQSRERAWLQQIS